VRSESDSLLTKRRMHQSLNSALRQNADSEFSQSETSQPSQKFQTTQPRNSQNHEGDSRKSDVLSRRLSLGRNNNKSRASTSTYFACASPIPENTFNQTPTSSVKKARERSRRNRVQNLAHSSSRESQASTKTTPTTPQTSSFLRPRRSSTFRRTSATQSKHTREELINYDGNETLPLSPSTLNRDGAITQPTSEDTKSVQRELPPKKMASQTQPRRPKKFRRTGPVNIREELANYDSSQRRKPSKTSPVSGEFFAVSGVNPAISRPQSVQTPCPKMKTGEIPSVNAETHPPEASQTQPHGTAVKASGHNVFRNPFKK